MPLLTTFLPPALASDDTIDDDVLTMTFLNEHYLSRWILIENNVVLSMILYGISFFLIAEEF